MSLESSASPAARSEAWSQETLAQVRGRRDLEIMYGTAARLYRPLLAVCAMTLVPGLVTPLAVAVALGDRIAIVNGSPLLLTSSPRVLWTYAGVLLIMIAAGLACSAAGSRLVVDHIDGRPLSPARAVLAVLRRPHAFLLLAAELTLAAGVLLVLVVVVAELVKSIVLALTLAATAGVFTLPALLALTALTVLPGRVTPLRTAFRLAARDYAGTAWRVALGCLVIPGLAQAALYGLRFLLPVPTGVAIDDAVRVTAAVLLAPFQAATLGCCYAYLRKWDAPEPTTTGEPARRRTRSWPVVAALLPGLLYGGFAAANPLGRAEVVDNELIAKERYPDQPISAQIVTGSGGRPVIITDRGTLKPAFCGDGACARQAAVPLGAYLDGQSVAAAMPDDSVLIPGWVYEPGPSDDVELHLFSCSPGGCARRPGRPLRLARKGWLHVNVAAAATPDGVAIASIAPEPGSGGVFARVELTLCRDAACAAPRTITVGRLRDRAAVSVDNRTVAVASSPDGRPVIAYVDRVSRRTTVVSCDSPACPHPRTHAFTASEAPEPVLWGWLTGSLRIQMAIGPDGRPVIVENDPEREVTKIFFCPDRECSGPPRSATVSEIATKSSPGLALDAAGRPILAGYDTEDLRVTLLACEDTGCARRRLTHLIPANAFGPLDLVVGSDRRPRIVWYGTPDRGGTPTYHVLTCADPYCLKS
ncbi:hypothetical protein Msi02_05750 [Microbispora siamensis]|uniref:ABC transporter permease n=1 Tax=Microbispora siamensis TaxID=564413 RepID=A0ABQ4GED8_9ACTN|nr:hypothetical protein Msi02_05750 [Microbispora siamensis]